MHGVNGTIWQTFIINMLLHFTSRLSVYKTNLIFNRKRHRKTENTQDHIHRKYRHWYRHRNLTEKVFAWDNEILSYQMFIQQYGYGHFVQFFHHTVHLVVKGSCENHLNLKCNTLPNHMECCQEETCLLTSQSTIIQASISSHASYSGRNVLWFFRFQQ